MELVFGASSVTFTSPSQRARVLTEHWVGRSAFCPNCGSDIARFPNNQPVADFFCSQCPEQYELKSQKKEFGKKAVDGAFEAMCARLASDKNPNLMLLNYDLERLRVTNFFVVPKQFFVRDIIECRKPLAITARRAGWTGCNILLERIPDVGKIFYIRDGAVMPRKSILTQWQRTLFLRSARSDARGWLIEVMKRLDRFGQRPFGIEDVYSFAGELSRLYPNNRNVKPKIRQQLQFLRDRGYLEFTSRGRYKLRAGQ